ncbi:MAG: response regulator transcription factor [Bacteroidota bacterium]
MLVDDHNMARQGFRAYLETDERFKITGEAANGLELIERLKINAPDIVLLDLEMPIMSGLETLAVLKEEYPLVKTIILSSHYNEFLIAELMIAGANGYLPKNCFGDDLFETVIKVSEEEYYFSQSVSKQVITTLMSDKKLQHLISEQILTKREVEVLQQICNEKQAKEIANLLHISENTVEFHKRNLYDKTKADSVVGLVKYAIRMGIVNA